MVDLINQIYPFFCFWLLKRGQYVGIYLKSSSQTRVSLWWPIEELWQVSQHGEQLLLAVGQVGQQVGRRGEEHIVHISHNELSGLTGTLHYLIELNGAVIRDEANLETW